MVTFWGSTGLSDMMSPFSWGLDILHDNILSIVISTVFFVGFLLYFLCKKYHLDTFFIEHSVIETTCTIWVMLAFVYVGVLSLKAVFFSTFENLPKYFMTLKVVGHQWYWSYEYLDFPNIYFDSHLVSLDSLTKGGFRNLEVDTQLCMCFGQPILLIISSADVLHCWTIPSMGLKMDAVPGKLNYLVFFTEKPGIFFGQCSEMCGVGHSFMPIGLEIISPAAFLLWTKNFS